MVCSAGLDHIEISGFHIHHEREREREREREKDGFHNFMLQSEEYLKKINLLADFS